MTPDRPLLESRDGPIARLTLNRPDLRNAFDETLIAALTAAVRAAANDPVVRVLARVMMRGVGAMTRRRDAPPGPGEISGLTPSGGLICGLRPQEKPHARPSPRRLET